jgi:hypothetical protein
LSYTNEWTKTDSRFLERCIFDGYPGPEQLSLGTKSRLSYLR